MKTHLLLLVVLMILPHAVRAQTVPFQFSNRGSILDIKFSPDGSKLLSYSSGEQTMCLWDVNTGRLLWKRPISFIQKADDYYTLNAFAWSGDQKLIATGSGNGTVQLWEAETGKFLWRADVHEEQVTAVGFAPDGKTVVAAGMTKDSNGVAVLKTADGTLFKRLEGIACTGIAISFAGPERFRIGTLDGTVSEWDIASGKQAGESNAGCREMRAYDWDTSFSRDLRISVKKKSRTEVVIVDTGTRQVIKTIRANDSKITSATSGDGRKVAISESGGIRYHDLQTLAELEIDECSGGNTFDLNNDGSLFAQECNIYSTAIKVTNIRTGKSWRLDAHPGYVNAMVAQPDGRTIAVAGNDGNVYIFDAASHALHTVLAGNDSRLTAVAFTPDGKTLISGDEHGGIRKWELSSAKVLIEAKLDDRRNQIEEIEFDKTGDSFLVRDSGRVAVCDSATLQPRTDFSTREGYESRSGNLTIGYETVPTTSAFYSWERGRVVTSHQDGTIRTWAAADGKEIMQFKVGDSVAFAASVPKSRTLVALVETKGKKALHLINGDTGSTLATSKSDDDFGYFKDAVISPDGRHVIAVNIIGDVKFWSLPGLKPERTIDYEYSGDDTVVFTPDSRSFFIGGKNQNLYQYETETGKKMWQLLPTFVPSDAEKRLVAEKKVRVAEIREAKRRREQQALKDVREHGSKVYLKFDHYGTMSDPGEKRLGEPSEPKESIGSTTRDKANAAWLRLYNDSPLPIEVRTLSMYISNRKCFHSFTQGEKMYGLCDKSEISVWFDVQDRNGKDVPYGFDFGSSAILLPGTSVTFPVPLALLDKGHSIVFDYSFQNVRASRNDREWDYGEKIRLRFSEKDIPK